MTLKVGIPKKISIKYNAYLLDETDSTITIETSEEKYGTHTRYTFGYW